MARTAGTAVAKAKSANLPANLAAEMANEVAALASRLQAPTGDRIKIDNKQFKLPNGETSDMVSGVIVDFVYYNAYYSAAYDPNNITPPDCFSLAVEPTGAIPSPNSPDVQATKCADCWANQFGSAGKGKACRNSVLLAMLPPDATEETPLMLLNVSPTGIKPFSAYVSSVARALQRPQYAVVTDVVCDPNVKYDTLKFGNPTPVDADLLALVRSRREEARQRLMVEPDVSQVATQKVAAPKSKLAAPKRRAA